jgi:prepilin-type N-terminal cleavage/methylation domain-containing protein
VGTVPKIFKTQDGFTLIEIISVLVILGILVVVAVSRMSNHDVAVYTGADALKAHLRYAQTMAMNKDPNTSANTETIMGINYDAGANQYWLFKGINTSDIIFLPDDSKYIAGDRKIDLTAKKITITFSNGVNTIYFDNHGIPYTSYTTSMVNTLLADPLTITVTALSGGSSKSLKITPQTGFIP